MKLLPIITLFTTMLGLSGIACASDNGIYLGVAAGGVESSVSKDTTKGLVNNFKGKDAAYKAILGVRPFDWLGAEVNYLDLGKPDNNSFAADTTGISGSVAGFASLGPVVDVFAKGGLVNWKSKITASKSELFSRDGTDLVYGGGLVVHLLSLSVRAEYEHFDIEAGANLVSLGVTWTFL